MTEYRTAIQRLLPGEGFAPAVGNHLHLLDEPQRTPPDA